MAKTRANWATGMAAAACVESLGLSADFPLQRWLRNPEAKTSGYVLLAGNASAHAQALECELHSAARES